MQTDFLIYFYTYESLLCVQKPVEGIRLSETEVTNEYTPQCEHWEPNHVILEEEQALLNAEPYPATSSHFLK